MSRIYNKDLTSVIVASGTKQDPLVLEGIVRKLDNVLFLCWTGGGKSEPCCDNVTLYRRSFDGGRSWTETKILFAHPHKGIFTPALFVNDKTLYAFPNSYYNHTAFCEDMQSYYSISSDLGETFSIPRSIAGCINNIHIKCTLKVDNRWIFACSWREIGTDIWASFHDQNKECVVAGNVFENPNLDAWQWYNSHPEYCGVLISDDNGNSFKICGRIGGENRSFVEPMMTTLSDGTFIMLLRTNEHRLYESRSYDGGETWTAPIPTDIPSAITKVLLLKDSAGKIYLLHNPNPIDLARNPLSLWISDDDMKCWGKKIELIRDDNAPLCYPDGFIDESRGKLCFAWDDRKNIYYSEFPI